MPKILSTSLRQEQGQEKNGGSEEEGEETLFRNCLTSEEADYSHFAEPGGIMGFGIAVARTAGKQETDDYLEPVAKCARRYWSDDHSTDTKHVLGRLIDAYGCKPVKKIIQQSKPEIERKKAIEEWEKKWRTGY